MRIWLSDELDGRVSNDLDWLADSYAEVHQATGMSQIQLDTTAVHALLRLRTHAYTHDLTVNWSSSLCLAGLAMVIPLS